MGKLRAMNRKAKHFKVSTDPWPCQWNFIDDYSGAKFNSKLAVRDHNGFITVRRFKDEVDPRRDKRVIAKFSEQRPSWVRPEQGYTFVDADTSNGSELLG